MWHGVDAGMFYRMLQRHGLHAKTNGDGTISVYEGTKLLTTGRGVDPLYRWLRARYSPMPSAADIQMAKSLLKPKAERMTKAELKKRARSVIKDRERAAERYPWLK